MLEAALRRFNAYSFCAYSFAWIPVTYPFFTGARGFSNREFFALNAVYYLTMCAFEVPTGALADAIGRRRVLFAGSIGLAASFALIFSATSLFGAAAGMALMGLSHTLISGADSAWLYDTLQEAGLAHEYLQREGQAGRMRMLGVFVADVLGGAAAQWIGFGAAFAVSIGFMLAAAACCARFAEPCSRRERTPRPSIAKSFARTARDAPLRWICLYATLLFLLLRVAFHFYQPHMHEVGIDDYFVYGLTLGALNFIAAPLSGAAHRLDRRLGERRLATLLLVLMAASFVLLWLLPTRWSIAFFVLQQVPYGLMNPVARNYTNRHLDSNERATMLSIQSFTGRLATALFLLGAGESLDRAGSLGPIYLGAGLATAAAAVVLHLTMPQAAANRAAARGAGP